MKKMLIVIICVLLSTAVLFASSLILLFPSFFNNSTSLNLDENKEIKKTILSAIKDRYSYVSENNSNLYDQESSDKIVQLYDPYQDKHLLCILAPNFMDTVEIYADDTYSIKVKMYYPVDCYHEFRIKKTQSGYIIAYWEIDI